MSGHGHLIAAGRTSEVYAFGTSDAVKVPRPGVPPHWAGVEARLTEAIHGSGLPCPEVKGLVEIDGRESIVFERIDGPSLWQRIIDEPQAMAAHVEVLVELQRTIRRVGSLPPIPRLSDRIRSKILAAEGLDESERREAASLAISLPDGSSLCHGDLHPANVLLGDGGPVVIDWFDAAAGPPAADLVRTSLLVRPLSRGRDVPHLPGAEPNLLADLHRHYVGQAVTALIEDLPCSPEQPVSTGAGSKRAGPKQAGPKRDGLEAGGSKRASRRTLADELLCWEQVLAAGRLAEHTTADRGDLLRLLRADDGAGERSALDQTLVELGLGHEG